MPAVGLQETGELERLPFLLFVLMLHCSLIIIIKPVFYILGLYLKRLD